MSGKKLKRKSFFVDEQGLRRAKRVLKASSESEAIRIAVAQVVEMDAFWAFMTKSKKSLRPKSFER